MKGIQVGRGLDPQCGNAAVYQLPIVWILCNPTLIEKRGNGSRIDFAHACHPCLSERFT
jgi:hypothetical protein